MRGRGPAPVDRPAAAPIPAPPPAGAAGHEPPGVLGGGRGRACGCGRDRVAQSGMTFGCVLARAQYGRDTASRPARRDDSVLTGAVRWVHPRRPARPVTRAPSTGGRRSAPRPSAASPSPPTATTPSSWPLRPPCCAWPRPGGRRWGGRSCPRSSWAWPPPTTGCTPWTPARPGVGPRPPARRPGADQRDRPGPQRDRPGRHLIRGDRRGGHVPARPQPRLLAHDAPGRPSCKGSRMAHKVFIGRSARLPVGTCMGPAGAVWPPGRARGGAMASTAVTAGEAGVPTPLCRVK